MRFSAPIARLQAMLDDHVNNFGAVGVVVGIDVPGQERVRVTSGQRALQGDKLNASHLFQIGSQTKTFVAVAILALANDGLISLDEPVIGLLDLDIDPRVTVRHLVMNTSGLQEFLNFARGEPTQVKTPIELVAPALKEGLLFSPGERFDYTNTGWTLAAMVLDARAPGGYRGFVRERIFRPLGLKHSYVASGYPEDQLAHGYIARPGEAQPIEAARGFSLSWAYGAGDIISSCDDMIDFFRALSRPGNAVGVTLSEMTRTWVDAAAVPTHPASLGAAYALGLERRMWGGQEVWGHPGRIFGYGASTWIAPLTQALVSTAYMYVDDASEDRGLAAQRYNPALVFTQALTTAFTLCELEKVVAPALSPPR